MSSFVKNEITNIEYSYFEDQYKNKQDLILPQIKVNNKHHAYLYFDGHGNNDCIDILRKLDNNKLKELLNENTKECMDYIANLTNKCYGGAMITLIEIINDDIPYIKISWLGDSLVYVYNENNEIIGNSYCHNIIDDPNSLPQNCIIDRPLISSSPQKDGISQKINYDNEVNPYYKLIVPSDNKRYGGEAHTIACTRSLGHRGIFLSDQYSEKIIYLTEKGKYKIIGGSDGIWDVMHPSDIYLNDKTNARNIVKECRIRWRKEWIIPNYRKNINDSNSDFFPSDTTTFLDDQDDICCICCIITVN
jgi:serine/threonine protein phosphatase PrpC